MMRPKVYVESPFAATDPEQASIYKEYAMQCALDCITEYHENPFLSHFSFTQFLRDTVSGERELGMTLGFEWQSVCQKEIVYYDFGISPGMREGIESACRNVVELHFRRLLPHKLDAILSKYPKARDYVHKEF